MHDEANKELEEKIADLERQIKRSITVERIPSDTPSEPAQEMPEPAQEIDESPQEIAEPSEEISTEVDQSVRARELQERVRALLQESKPSEQSESEVPLEAPKKKKRFF